MKTCRAASFEVLGARTAVLILFAVVPVSGCLAQASPKFTSVAEAASPAVVNISTTQKDGGSDQVPRNRPFYEFFREIDNERTPEREGTSRGSGFIVSPDGYVVTNNHVVKNADSIVVRLGEQREFEAAVIGGNEASDTALLKIDASDLPAVKLAKESDLKVGEWVLAIGSPFGFDHSVTAGVVSAKWQSIGRAAYIPFVDTDATINPGNSGGPLFNMDGEVVAVNTAFVSGSGGYMGMSFAIPIDVAMNVVEQLESKGSVSHGWLGVRLQDVSAELAESFGLDRPTGALISGKIEETPAEDAGLQVGDIVLSFNGCPIRRSSELPPSIGAVSPGEQVPVTVLRNQETLTLTVIVGELPAPEYVTFAPVRPDTLTDPKIGLILAESNHKLHEELGVSATGGVLVVQVDRGPAARADIRPGDVILKVGATEVDTVNDFSRSIRRIETDRPISVLVQREGNPLFLALEIGQ